MGTPLKLVQDVRSFLHQGGDDDDTDGSNEADTETACSRFTPFTEEAGALHGRRDRHQNSIPMPRRQRRCV
jgi:hypothetical protein